MSQVPTGTSDAGPATAGNAAAPSGQQAPTAPPQTGQAAPALAGQQAQTAQDMIQAPKAAFAPFGGDYHEAVRLGKVARELEQKGLLDVARFIDQRGWDAGEVLRAFQTSDSQPAAGTDTPGAPPPPPPTGQTQPQPLTLDAVQKVLNETLEQREKRQTESARTQQELEQRRTAFQTEQQWTNQLAGELKIAPDRPQAGAFKHFADMAVQQAIRERLKDNWQLTEDQKTQMAKSAVATPADLTRAAEIAKGFWADMVNDIKSALVSGQLAYPSATVAGGAGGSLPPPNPANMSRQEKFAYVTAGM